MLGILFICGLIAGAFAGYSSSTGAGAGAGVYNSNSDRSSSSYGSKYPYSNRYQGYQEGVPYYQPFAPLPPIPSPWDYQNAFNQYFSQFNQNFANQFNAQLAQQAAFFNAVRNQAQGGYGGYAGGGGYAGSGTGGYGSGNYGPNYQYSAAGGAYGPSGVYQHASIYPQNPANPNVDVYQRFGENGGTVTHTKGPGGFVGISSFSSSSDINGVKNRESATSVNDNGKVTTYHVRN